MGDDVVAKLGRTSKRTPETEQRLLTVLRAGNTRTAACAYAGISTDTLARWLAASADFAANVRKSELEPLIESIGRIRQAGRGGMVIKEVTVTTTRSDGTVVTRREVEYTRPEWTADAWYAERKHPDDWAKRETLRIEHARILEDTRRLAEERGLDPDAAVAEAKALLGVK